MRYNFSIAVSLLIIVFLLLCPSISRADSNSLDQVLLTADDMPGLKLLTTQKLSNYWSVVLNLPGLMQHPEDPVITPGDTGSNLEMLDDVEMKMTKNDGIRQKWMTDKNVWVIVDYGIFDSPKQAQDSLCYIVYERTIPFAIQNWRSLNYQAEYSGNVYPSCRKLDIGDLGYFVTPFTGGGSMIYFTKGNFIFMVDSLQQTAEDAMAKALLGKF